MARLLKDDPHISDAAKNMGRVNAIGYPPDERLMPYLEQAGFGSAALIRTFALHYDLLSALVERGKFGQLSANATEGELMCAARAYIMHLIGGVLMPDSNNNKVHIMYLPLLADLSNARSYSWGSTVLAYLYRDLCRLTKPTAVDMGGCLTLLQSWALYRMPFLASVSHQPYVYPLVNRWSIYLGIERSYTVPIYRMMIKQHARERSGTMAIVCYDNSVASNISRILRSTASWHSFGLKFIDAIRFE
ncbi:hypothetical protein J1N35_019736 [Gossypium stocksii]|uniref:Aminotransferase-like plant mobile domain-containing protein n=1 Tax=Gossypium stocksii TaxID=47602 RepID=A0A9D4A0C2_9ROSI|nr:hypothetical protein J1N35_019736 [Gossypium stocksii]